MPVVNRQQYISYTDLVDSAPFPIRYGYIVWTTETPDVARAEMPALPDPISGAAALIGEVQVIRKAPVMGTVSKIGGTYALEVSPPPTPGIIEGSIVADADPIVLGTTISADEGGWTAASNSAGQTLPIEYYEYRWLRNDVVVEGETTASYVISALDSETELRCEFRAVSFGQSPAASWESSNALGIPVLGSDLGDPLVLYDAAIGVEESPGIPAGNFDYVEIWQDQGLSTVNAEQVDEYYAPVYSTPTSSLSDYPSVIFNHYYEMHMLVPLAESSTSWTLYVALYDAAASYEYTGDNCFLDVESGPLRFRLRSVAEGATVSLYDGSWRTFGPVVDGEQVLTWVLDGATNLCRLYRGRAQVGSDQPYTPRILDGIVSLGGSFTAGFMEGEIARIALYPTAHDAALRTEVWDAWAADFPTLL